MSETTYGEVGFTVPEMLAWLDGDACAIHETDMGDALTAALERIPELERRLDEVIDQNIRQATRQERLEAAARVVAYADVRICGLCRPDRYHEHSADCPVMALRAALAPAPEGSEPPSDDTAERAIGRFVQERRRDGWEVLLERGDVTERMVLPAPVSGEETADD